MALKNTVRYIKKLCPLTMRLYWSSPEQITTPVFYWHAVLPQNAQHIVAIQPLQNVCQSMSVNCQFNQIILKKISRYLDLGQKNILIPFPSNMSMFWLDSGYCFWLFLRSRAWMLFPVSKHFFHNCPSTKIRT